MNITRRQMLLSVPGLALAPRLTAPWRVGSLETRLFAQAAAPPIRVRALNHMTLAVSDPKRTIEFYQGLFGMPIQARQGPTTLLRIGPGPQFLAVSAAAPNTAPAINHFCFAVEGFNADRIVKLMTERGLTRADSGGPLTVRVRMRGPDAGGAKEGTAELYIGDPDGIVCQLQDVSYCGGAGVLGNVCGAVEASPKKGLLEVHDLSHFTIFSSDAQRANKFYQDLFGFSIRSYQGPTAPTLAVGSTVQFLMFTGGGAPARGGAAAAPRPATINHVCMNMNGFDPDKILKTLESFGIMPRGSATGPVGPMKSYVSMRMENRGGAPGGTPELYFTDPDGILIQLQDVSYCGGGGYLGDACPKL